jgi:hypothetical protein
MRKMRKMRKMRGKYVANVRLDNDLREIADDLITDHHRHILDNGVRILCAYSDQDRARYGKAIRVEITPLGGRAQWLSGFVDVAESEPNEGYDYMLTAYGSIWTGSTDVMREAAVDEQLCRLVEKTVQTRDGETTVIKIRDFDVRGFVENIQRFGLWESGKRIFAAKSRQLPLDLTEAEKSGQESGIGEAEPVAAAAEPEDADEGKPRKLAAVK